MRGLKDKSAIVTGGSRGIGLAIAKRLAEGGANVVIASRKAEPLEAAAVSLREAGLSVTSCPVHTGKLEDIERLLSTTIERHGQVDVLVNNAATNPYFGPMLDTEDAAWDKTFEVNVRGYFYAARGVCRHVLERNGTGSIINVTSVLGDMSAPFQGVYGMTKAAVISMTRTLAQEVGQRGLRINAIAPGLIETRFAAALTTNTVLRNQIIERTAVGRLGQPEDIAGMAAFLASDESAYVTGQVLTVDGGWTV